MLDIWAKEDLSRLSNDTRNLLRAAHNQLKDHMQPGDICAIMKEKRGIKMFRPNGKELNHVDEWEDAKSSFRKTFESLKECDDYAIWSKRISEISNLWERYDPLISKGAKKCTMKPMI